MLIDQLRVGITGGPIGLGVATHYGLQGSGQLTTWMAFWEAVAPRMPLSVTVHVPNEGDRIEVETGILQSVWTAPTAAADFHGVNAGTYAAGVGACVTWLTEGIVAGHRVRGRTFLVPLESQQYDLDGTIQTVALAGLRAAAQGVVDDAEGNSVIYSRPREGRAGTAHAITGYRISDRVATLRSRR